MSLLFFGNILFAGSLIIGILFAIWSLVFSVRNAWIDYTQSRIDKFEFVMCVILRCLVFAIVFDLCGTILVQGANILRMTGQL